MSSPDEYSPATFGWLWWQLGHELGAALNLAVLLAPFGGWARWFAAAGLFSCCMACLAERRGR